MINENGNIIQALATAPETCLPEQDSPGSRAVTQRLRRPRRASGAIAERCNSVAQSRSPRFTTRPGSLRQFGNCHGLPGDLALRQITGNSFCFPFRRGVSQGCYRPSTSRPLGLPACQREPSPNALLAETSAQTEGFVTSEIRRRWLRPVVSSDRRLAVEIPAVRSSCNPPRFSRMRQLQAVTARYQVLRATFSTSLPAQGILASSFFNLKSEFTKMPERQ